MSDLAQVSTGDQISPDTINALINKIQNGSDVDIVIASTVADADNKVNITLIQNDVTNNPNTIDITNAGSGNSLTMVHNGDGGYGFRLEYTGDLSSNNAFRMAYSGTSSGTANIFEIRDTPSNARPLFKLSHAGTAVGMLLSRDHVNACTLFNVRNIRASTSGAALVYVNQDHPSCTDGALVIKNDGSGNSLRIDDNGSGYSLTIDKDSNDASDTWAVSIASDNAGAGDGCGINLSSFSAGERLLAVPADTNDPTGGGGAADGRIAIDVGGSLKYIPYYDS
jgi:hypothetical protein